MKIDIVCFFSAFPVVSRSGVVIYDFFKSWPNKKKFDSRFNIRLNDSFRFKNNIEHKKCLKFISKSKQSIEVFAFS